MLHLLRLFPVPELQPATRSSQGDTKKRQIDGEVFARVLNTPAGKEKVWASENSEIF